MNRQQLEHIIRATAGNADTRDIVIVGSQAILGTYPDAPPELTMSMEADVFPKENPREAILIDGAIGELSIFHQTFGYYAHGVDETTAVLPEGWRERLVPIRNENTLGATGLVSRSPRSGREQAGSWAGEGSGVRRCALSSGVARAEIVRERLTQTEWQKSDARALALARLERLAAQ